MEQIIQFLETIIFRIGNPENGIPYIFTFLNLLYISILLIITSFVFTKYKKIIIRLTNQFEIAEKEQATINRVFKIILFWTVEIGRAHV
jgi:hypothetical protein